jgi:4-amino-4-deoxy-L-arabinose transferase-like glycosyltransferase
MVKPNTNTRRFSRLAIAVCTFFFLAGQPFLPRLGIEDDESIFGYAFLEPRAAYFIPIRHSRVPLMLMSYLGTLKAWLYKPIFLLFGVNVWSVREPALLAGAAGIWFFYLFLRRVAGERAALIGCGLLAADSMYLLTVCFDWGPVALQHLLLIGGLYLLTRFYQKASELSLAGGFLLWGLAMWDKALAIWMLGAFGVAGLVIFWRQILAVTTFRRVAISVAAFALGALPLIVYNVDKQWATFRGQGFGAADLQQKAHVLMYTAEGVALHGWMVDDDWQAPEPHAPASALEKASRAISEAAGRPRRGLLLWAFALALLLAPLARGPALRAILFALIAMAVQWTQMAITVGAGGGVHHVILLWPLPQMVIGVSFAAASRRLGRAGRPVAACAVAVVMLTGALPINEYYRMVWQNGGAANWTDAINRLYSYVRTTPEMRVYCVDWGIVDQLRLLGRGKLLLSFDFVPTGGPDPDPRRVAEAAGEPDHLFVSHTKDFEVFPSYGAAFVADAEAAGYRRDVLRVISDSWGRPTFEVYRFVR